MKTFNHNSFEFDSQYAAVFEPFDFESVHGTVKVRFEHLSDRPPVRLVVDPRYHVPTIDILDADACLWGWAMVSPQRGSGSRREVEQWLADFLALRFGIPTLDPDAQG